MKKKLVLALAGVLIVAVAGWWWNGSGDRMAAKSARPAAAGGAPANGAPAALVTLATAERQDVPVTVQVNGSVVSLNSVDLRPQVTNTVAAVHVKEGQFVKEGQLLFTLDDRNDQANLARARAQQKRDEATMADLERQYRRSQELLAQNFISKSATDATLSQLEAQRAAVAADRAAVQSAQVALGYATLRAPIAGRIGAVNIYPGTLVQPTLSLVTITQLDPIAVSFPVPEANLQDLLAAARSRAKVEALVSGRKEPLSGVLNFVDNTVDPQIGTVRAKAVFDNADQSLWPGQFVGTRITVRTLSGATVVPAAALMMLSDGASLYVVDQAMNAKRRKVQVLYTFGTKVAVSGVEPGEQVVIEGSQNVRPGGKVRVDKKPAPAGTTGVTPGSAASSDTQAPRERA
ncbi:RND family efflux transporter MFP subunit [Variovorax beijingensis]|uniref:RND family efflux transporter MFP subunit n=3 Tax=Comamonadaceae TaxID=80864 RepID=A0AAE3XTU9_VARPD|nr:RND family efflux transporter MFP subunit [Variovorax paradoxus]MDR6424167.1 RND family efflux transporter MFP subunit [Variovorax paradoxus]MDR6452559.1 RND family efflux transporter MFP subunit [Variovorax paradoxus]TWD88393.1 RND family efflux transporter MFP subunit [Variovorax beijingensis]